MNKRYQVFVSSTFTDLKAEREEVIQSLLEFECIPAGMELFPAANDEQWGLIKRVIDESDYYLVIIAGRYGSIHPITEKSFTQMEYEYAIEQGKPVLGFLHADPDSIAVSKTESAPDAKAKLQAFRELVQTRMCRYWSSPQELGALVLKALNNATRTFPAVGWIRGDQVAAEDTTKELLRLTRRVTELEEQLEAANNSLMIQSEELAQGEQVFTVHYSYLLMRDITDSFTQRNEFFRGAQTMTWNDLFSATSGHLFVPTREPTMKQSLEESLKQSILGELEKRHNRPVVPYHNLQNFFILQNDFDTIKIQLRALGLTELSKKTGSDGNPLWQLTKRGEEYLVYLKSIRAGGVGTVEGTK